MDKKTEALKLARHVMRNQGDIGVDEWIAAEKAINEALAEQPAQGCEFCSHPLYAGTKCKNCGREQPAQQQEPVEFDVRCDDCGGGGLDRTDNNYRCAVCDGSGFVEKMLYTSPPASKPWVGLTNEEMRDLEKQFNAERVRTSDEEYLVIYPGDYWAWQRAIEAKLREKNA